jgi:hypothetical protein
MFARMSDIRFQMGSRTNDDRILRMDIFTFPDKFCQRAGILTQFGPSAVHVAEDGNLFRLPDSFRELASVKVRFKSVLL